MSRLPKVTLLLAATFGVVAASHAAIPERYQSIIDRNAFGLNPPPPVVEVAPPPPTPPANVKLTGFATIGGKEFAYFSVAPKDVKETTQYLSLSEGQREGAIELVTIKSAEGEVIIKNNGIQSPLNFTNNVAKGAPGQPMPPPGMNPPGQPPVIPGQPPAQPVSAIYNPGASASVFNTQPNNPVPAQNVAPQNAAPGHEMPIINNNPPPAAPMIQPQTQPGAPGNYRTIPSRSIRGSGQPQSSINVGGQPVVFNPNPVNQNPSVYQPPQPEVTDPAVQVVSMEVQREMAQRRGIPMPPTPGSP